MNEILKNIHSAVIAGFRFVLQPTSEEFQNPADARAFVETLAEEDSSQ